MSSDAVLLIKLSDGDVSSSNKISLSAAVNAANLVFCTNSFAFDSSDWTFDCDLFVAIDAKIKRGREINKNSGH